MANVKFKRLLTSELASEAIEDGKTIWIKDGNNGLYMDVGTTREQMIATDTALSTTSTNPIQNQALTNSIVNDLATAIATTANYIPCGTNAVKELSTSLDWIDITSQCTWSPLLNTTALGGINHYVKVNTKTRTVDVCGFFNAGRANTAALITIPTTYVPSLTLLTPLGVARYDSIKTISVNYFIKPNGEIVGLHSLSIPTGIEENIHLTFTY